MSPENEGGGSASRTGPRRPNRALNSEFIDIQQLHQPLRQAAQSGDTERIRPCALNIQPTQYGRAPVQVHIEHNFEFECANQQPNENEVAGLDL
jgi:hypothetical protein